MSPTLSTKTAFAIMATMETAFVLGMASIVGMILATAGTCLIPSGNDESKRRTAARSHMGRAAFPNGAMDPLVLLSGISVLFFSVLAALGWGLRRPWLRAEHFLAAGGRARGHVVAHLGSGRSGDDGAILFTEVVEFRDREGVTFRVVSLGAAPNPAPLGTALEVAYNLRDPNDAVLVAGARAAAIFFTVAGGLCALCAVACTLACMC